LLSTPFPIAPEEFQLLNEFISERFGIHFSDGKQAVLANRLRPRLQALGLNRYMDYYLLLQYRLDSEQEHLTRLVTNNETYFFRETTQFEALLEEAAETLLAAPAAAGSLRILCAGCSSGEEPYTLNVFARSRPHALGGARLSIDAFDIDARRLSTAIDGVYGPSSLRATSEEQKCRPHEKRCQRKQILCHGWGMDDIACGIFGADFNIGLRRCGDDVVLIRGNDAKYR